MDRKLQVAVVGATGVVGREVLGELLTRGYPAENITALASERSETAEIEYGDETLEVEKVTPESFRGMGLVILATPADVSRSLASHAQLAGAWVVDLSAAYRHDAQIPLVLPGVNEAVLTLPFKGRIVSVPSAVSTALLLVLDPLVQAFGVAQAQVTALIGASVLGRKGIAELEKQTADLLSGRESEATAFPHRVGLNFFPQVGDFPPGSPWTTEETTWRQELGRVWAGRPTLPQISGTAVQVPTFFGHGLSLVIQLEKAATVEQVRQALTGRPQLKLLDAPEEKVYPMPMLVTADQAVHVGRLRALPDRPDAFALFAVVDNAGRGGAVTAVDLGERLAAVPTRH